MPAAAAFVARRGPAGAIVARGPARRGAAPPAGRNHSLSAALSSLRRAANWLPRDGPTDSHRRQLDPGEGRAAPRTGHRGRGEVMWAGSGVTRGTGD